MGLPLSIRSSPGASETKLNVLRRSMLAVGAVYQKQQVVGGLSGGIEERRVEGLKSLAAMVGDISL